MVYNDARPFVLFEFTFLNVESSEAILHNQSVLVVLDELAVLNFYCLLVVFHE